MYRAISTWISAGLFFLLMAGCGGYTSHTKKPDTATVAKPAKTSALSSTGADTSESLARAKRRAHLGDIDGAIQTPEDLHRRRAGVPGSHLMLGKLLDFDGSPEEAVEVWEAGCSGIPDDVPLLLAIADLRSKQAKSGPQVSRRRGTVTFRPAKPGDPSKEDYALDRLRLAAAAAERALRLKPEDLNIVRNLAQIYLDSKRYADALPLWQKVLQSSPGDPKVLSLMATTLHGMGRDSEALEAALEAVRADPSTLQALRLIRQLQTAAGQEAEARATEKRIIYYAWLPAFINMEFTDERYAFVAHFTGRSDSGTAVDHGKEIDRLIAEGTDEARVFLAAICWRHGHHGELENRAFRALEEQRASDLLLAMLKNAWSTCTVRNAARALARIKDHRAVAPLVRLLPGDVLFHLYSDVAGALAMLGDARAVDPLITVLAPHYRTLDNQGKSSRLTSLGRRMARERAALALGHFDTERTLRALRDGLANPEIAGACHLSLYRLSGDRKHLEAVEAHLKDKSFAFEIYVLNELRTISSKEAKTLAEEYRDQYK